MKSIKYVFHIQRAISDNELINLLKGIRTERNRALEAIYRSNRDRICGFVISNKGTEIEATDLFQEVMIALYENVKNGSVKEDHSISNFLFSLAKFKWLKELNSEQDNENLQQEAIRTGIDMELIGEGSNSLDDERGEQVREIMGLLGFDCKHILIESIYHNTTVKEIAFEGNFSDEDNVRAKKYECLNKLRDLMVGKPDLLKITQKDE